jgi:uncharacterized protein
MLWMNRYRRFGNLENSVLIGTVLPALDVSACRYAKNVITMAFAIRYKIKVGRACAMIFRQGWSNRLNRDEVLSRTADYVRAELQDDSSGHDWWHVHRVRELAVNLARKEGADVYVVELAALLHDISDYKLNGGDHEKGPQIAYDWLIKLGESDQCAHAVAHIIASLSFKGSSTRSKMDSIEGMIVQDADRLDAIGAIGIARAFAFGGYAGQLMYEPSLEPQANMTQSEYEKRNGTTVNHFYEKLLLLKARMNTKSARVVAEKRHRVLEQFLEEFFLEWNAEDANVDSALDS